MIAQDMIRQWAVSVHVSSRKKAKIDHRLLPRNPKRKFRHDEALYCINRDYLGIATDLSTPIFAGSEFASMFRISRSRFQRMLEDFVNSGDPFFTPPFVDATGEEGASLEARLLLPLKSISFGVPPKTFSDYFQMSKTLSKECYNNFLFRVTELYKDEYLRLPTEADIKAVTRLHKNVHGINGMFGSLDCMHTYWNKCPVAWQGSFKGKGHKPSIVLEAIAFLAFLLPTGRSMVSPMTFPTGLTTAAGFLSSSSSSGSSTIGLNFGTWWRTLVQVENLNDLPSILSQTFMAVSMYISVVQPLSFCSTACL